MARGRISRDEWRKRVQRWKDSGLTAAQFANEIGINAGTLQFWRSKLRQEIAGRRARPAADTLLSSLVEVHAPAHVSAETRFEVCLPGNRRVLVPSAFDPESLSRLIGVLEARS